MSHGQRPHAEGHDVDLLRFRRFLEQTNSVHDLFAHDLQRDRGIRRSDIHGMHGTESTSLKDAPHLVEARAGVVDAVYEQDRMHRCHVSKWTLSSVERRTHERRSMCFRQSSARRLSGGWP
jgi:hypothetical protein